MTPEEIANPGTEHSIQSAFFAWCNKQTHDVRLKQAFAIPNGGERTSVAASRLKVEGVKTGVPDIFIPIPVGIYHGLFIEFKKPNLENHKNGGLRPTQIEYRDYLISQKYGHFTAHSYLTAVEVTLKYLSHE